VQQGGASQLNTKTKTSCSNSSTRARAQDTHIHTKEQIALKKKEIFCFGKLSS